VYAGIAPHAASGPARMLRLVAFFALNGGLGLRFDTALAGVFVQLALLLAFRLEPLFLFAGLLFLPFAEGGT